MDAIVWALQDAVGPDGTLLALTGWEDSPPPRRILTDRPYTEQPAFDAGASAARREFGRFPGRLRTWPGVLRSGHPEVSFAAVGPAARELVADAGDDDPWGSGGPLGRLVARDGQVLLIGPITTLTLCHHAEAIARITGKRYHDYRMPVKVGDAVEWRDYRTLDTFYGTLPYWERNDLGVTGWVETMMQAVAAGATTAGSIDGCLLTVVDAPRATIAVRDWLEANFRCVESCMRMSGPLVLPSTAMLATGWSGSLDRRMHLSSAARDDEEAVASVSPAPGRTVMVGTPDAARRRRTVGRHDRGLPRPPRGRHGAAACAGHDDRTRRPPRGDRMTTADLDADPRSGGGERARRGIRGRLVGSRRAGAGAVAHRTWFRPLSPSSSARSRWCCGTSPMRPGRSRPPPAACPIGWGLVAPVSATRMPPAR